MNILVGEPSAVTRSIEKELFRQNPFFEKVRFARSWEEVLKKVREESTDGLIVDSALFAEKNFDRIILKVKAAGIKTVLFTDKKNTRSAVYGNIFVAERFSMQSASSEMLKEYAALLENLFNKLLFTGAYTDTARQNRPDDVVSASPAAERTDYKIVLIGVSTGGPGTVQKLLKDIGSGFPVPILITQHIDSNFDRNLIDWLNTSTSVPVKLAENGMVAENGHVYFAPADYHLGFTKSTARGVVLELNRDEPLHFLRPAVDKMFFSAADVFGEHCLAVLLTGMGNDGAAGCCRIKEKGGYTITESEESCVIYGMPKAAFAAGGSTEVLPLKDIAARLKELTGRVSSSVRASDNDGCATRIKRFEWSTVDYE
ncbi:CheB methylesterase domain-containing protein [Treponema brennaborense]|uniref:protein-glutamate methylesterase n=1 Tax=Treponema brennaborense (strain DSM 12168 / CIP 105900 / DD5/3) TaxID=906968 RepID=F4LNT2_TREBD|nr:CheB methylesterase domain-containing protein [Treponema brennaborense]AEE16917.1 CheB methylesterase [Treponema brennaborense DSM 12168]